jgi:hypothetical protein
VRLIVPASTLAADSAGRWAAYDERLSAYARLSVPVLVSIQPGPVSADAAEAWATLLRTVAERSRGRVAGYQIERPADGPLPDPRVYAFLLKRAAVQIKSIDAGAIVMQATIRVSDAAWQTSVQAEGTGAYVDAVAVSAADGAEAPGSSAALSRLIAGHDPTAEIVSVGVPVGDTRDGAAARWLTRVLGRTAASGVPVTTMAGEPAAVAAALETAGRMKDLLSADVAALDEGPTALAIRSGGADLTARLPHRLFYSGTRGSMHLIVWGADVPAGPLEVRIVDQAGRTPQIRDVVAGRTVPPVSFAWDRPTSVSVFTLEASREPMVVDFLARGGAQLAARTDVTAAAALDVGEIVAKHQQAQASQEALFQTYIATLRHELHFRPTPAQVFDVITENTFFFSRDVVEWVERSFTVNGTKWGPDHPDLPLLQAEKILTLPLDLRLDAAYRYRLDGIDNIGERPAYVVSFEPVDPSRAAYRGRVWIDAEHFLRLRLQTIQTQLSGEIVSNDETTRFEPVVAGPGRSVHLPVRVSTKQVLLVAGRNLLLEKEQWFSDFRIDAPGFEDERLAAHASRQVMFRDTDEGVRYLVKRGDERVVSQSLTMSSKALAMGTIIDPAFEFPLPIFGLNYLDFDFMGDRQLALLFGGVFALGNIQAPRIGGRPFDASVDFFGIAVPGTDVTFDAGGERLEERLLNIPASVGANAGYQLTPFQKIMAGYQFEYDAFFAAPETAVGFPQPANTITHGIHVRYEYSRRGYQFRLGGSFHNRANWPEWGRPGDYSESHKTYRRYGVGLSKDFLIGPFQTIHAGAAWYGGERLDRFSMFQFGLFDELRMHGVPAAGIRFPELALVRGAYSFNVFEVYRLDLFLDFAYGRDPFDRSVWRPITGTGFAVTFKTPWNTMFSADVGKSFLPVTYRNAGSVVLQFMLLKPL